MLRLSKKEETKMKLRKLAGKALKNKPRALFGLVVNYQLLKEVLEHITKDTRIYLYSNDWYPTKHDQINDYITTAESFELKEWTCGSDQIKNKYCAEHQEVIFNIKDARKYYGYIIINEKKHILLWAERFTDAPFELTSAGGKVAIKPRISFE